ncbi:MAG TPA: hypothetical protein VLO29_03025 [Salegentibacter sp.]|nr:hypothetical protein [Salegentibacter sp.]
MKNLKKKTKKWGKRALAFKVGKFAVRKGGLLGVGIGVAAGAIYLVYKFSNGCKNKQQPMNEVTADREKQIVV